MFMPFEIKHTFLSIDRQISFHKNASYDSIINLSLYLLSFVKAFDEIEVCYVLLFRPFEMEIIDTKMIQLENRFLSITFTINGAILSIQHKNFDEKFRFHINFVRYGTSKELDHHSGAYLFVPDGKAHDIPMSNYNVIRIQRGLLVNQVYIIHDLYTLQYKLTKINS